MPAIWSTDNNVTSELNNSQTHQWSPFSLSGPAKVHPDIYIALAAAVILLFVSRLACPRLTARRLITSGRRESRSSDRGRGLLAHPSGSAKGAKVGGHWSEALAPREQQQGLEGIQDQCNREAGYRAIRPLWLTGGPGIGLTGEMDQSRGVSSRRNGSAAGLSQGAPSPAAGESAQRSSSPRSPPLRSSDEVSGQSSAMDGHSWTGPLDPSAGSDSVVSRQPIARPAPPPLLTPPPTFSAAVFAFEDRSLSYAHSVPASRSTTRPASFIHRAKPDCIDSPAPISADVAPSAPSGAPGIRNHTKALPIGISTTQSAAAPFSVPMGLLSAADAFSSSSYPPTSLLLPPPPPGGHDPRLDGAEPELREMDVQGEAISVLDESGANWTRHTRVYGGGVCLACVAAGASGGVYGDKVRPEDRR
ncbi:hypothetical protein NKR23_g5496 [Pleurostoma richardsiae]|uniref:Uncharacterized protein n=1 Tax=Pleurostoma richardsiae TaxID=41990 RepID=A0AA38VQE6_9PEZI|nr:hypothetical protein NKR23_g5496 [Pleurostoma richardsiae]